MCVPVLYFVSSTSSVECHPVQMPDDLIFFCCTCMYTLRQKRNRFSFVNKCFNTQCNLTKFSTFIVNECYHRCYLFKCDVGFASLTMV